MPLDLEPIRERLARFNPASWWDCWTPEERAFVSKAPDDIAALLDEVERLRADLTATQEHRLADLAQPLYSNRVKVERIAPPKGPNGEPASFGWKVGWVADEVGRLRSELAGLRTYMTRSIAADLAGVPEALEILDGLADEDMATVDRWIAAMSPRCRHDAELERLRTENAHLHADLLVMASDRDSLDHNLKRCVNTLHNVGEIVGVDLNDLNPDLLDRVQAAFQARAAVADPCRLCGSPMALAEQGSGPGDEDLYRCSRVGCSGEYAQDVREPRFLVRLEPGCWIAEWTGDPGRTTVKASARSFPTERSARRALSKARRFREFPKAVVERAT